MNLYLILAIALGAISGATDAPVGRNASPVVAARRAERAAVSQVAAHVILSREDGEGPRRTRSFPPLSATGIAPLSGSATPRAPAVNC